MDDAYYVMLRIWFMLVNALLENDLRLSDTLTVFINGILHGFSRL